MLIVLLVDAVFMSYSVIIDKIGFNPALNQTLLTVSDLLGIVFSFFMVHLIKRKTSGIVIYLLSAILSLITFFIHIPSNCESCGLVFLQIGLVMTVRILIEFHVGILFVNLA